MANRHYEKWIIKAPAGFIFTCGGIFFMYYSLTQLTGELKDRWVYYGLASSLIVGIGVTTLCSAFVHKMKSDLIKKQRVKGQS